MYSLYTALLALALVISMPWWLLEMLRHGKYRAGWRERLGSVPRRILGQAGNDIIWIHAVSVGEVLAISRVVEELKSRLPDCRIVVSTTTDAGQKLAGERFGTENVFYFPIDLPFAVRGYLDRLHPRLLVLAESEFWPNLFRCAKQSGAAIAVVNARISDRSLPGYLRFQKLMRRVLRSVDLFLAQSDEDAHRLVRIGAPAERLHVSGNLKFEVKPPPVSNLLGLLTKALERENCSPVLVAGSTMEGEEAMLLETFRQVLSRCPRALLVLAPRHPERFAQVANILVSSGLGFQKRSQWDGGAPIAGAVLLLDSIGELASLYEIADLAFIGGSLVPRGGHNVLEAAQFGKTILVGPHTENFRDIVEVFRKAGALRVVTPEALTATVLHLLKSPDERQAVGRSALDVMRSQQGATERTVNALLELLPEQSREASAEVPSESGA